EEDPDPLSNVYWGGWDRTGVAPSGSICIHHPSTDEKAISWNDDLLTTMNSCIGGGSSTHWRVNDWEDGTTEPGSSGSGLWHPGTHRIIGFLSGGIASCSTIGYDCFGKFSLAWSGSSTSSRLSDWLDPIGSGAMTMDGSFSDGVGRVQFLAAGGTDACPSLPGNENGVWEPGETITIPVTVLSIGSHAGITGTLTTTTPGVTITDDTATWPDLAGGASSVSDDPHFQLVLDPSIACASTVDLDLSLSSAQGGPWLSSFANDIGGELTPVGLPLAIPDNVPSGVASPLPVSVDATLSDVEVYVKITHTRVGDLVLKLQSPLGTTVTLLDRPMWPQTTNGCQDDDMDITFTDTFFANLDTHCGGSTPWWTGDAKPMTPLSALDGESSQGTWNLIVEDHNGGDTGFLDEWRLLTALALPGVCEVCPTGATGAVAVAGEGVFGLRQNRPNPFADRTEIRFRLPGDAPTTLAVFDVTGRRIVDLVNDVMPAGEQFVVWNGRNAEGKPVAGGIYFYRLTSGGTTQIKRMHLVR
ncbi:proprotein convertase P-domain-containing protein, partial [bacterium]|nr:proprotein convertase P-domain-containing protein [bacterium]